MKEPNAKGTRYHRAITIYFRDLESFARIQQAAHAIGVPMSAWIKEAIARRLREDEAK